MKAILYLSVAALMFGLAIHNFIQEDYGWAIFDFVSFVLNMAVFAVEFGNTKND